MSLYEQEEFDALYEDLEDPFIGSLVSKVPWGKLAKTAGKSALSSLGGMLGEEESFDLEGNYEDFAADQLNGEMALMEVLAAEAAEADSEEEADAFIGAILPLATSLIPKLVPAAAKVGQAVLPSLVSGAKNLVSTLWKQPATRQLIQTIPTMARGTAATIAKQVAAGRPVTHNPPSAPSPGRPRRYSRIRRRRRPSSSDASRRRRGRKRQRRRWHSRSTRHSANHLVPRQPNTDVRSRNN